MTRVKDWLNRVLNRRKHKRFQTMEGTFVIVGPSTEKGRKLQVVDVSEGGLAFVYNGPRSDLDDEGTLALLAGDALYADRIPYATASDQPLGIGSDLSEVRRKGVQFRWLGVLDKSQLKRYIKDTALSEKE